MERLLPGKRVLIVEDNAVLAYDIDEALRESGAHVVGPVLDLDSGMALVREDSLDGAVLDIDIGGHPVWPLARELKQDGVPFVFVSGDCHKGLPDDFTGATCLSKPAPRDAILTTVAAVMEGR